MTDLLCQEPRCRTILPPDAEVCDECGCADLEPLGTDPAWLIGVMQEHPVAFPLGQARPYVIGRSAGDSGAPDVDLGRFAGNATVHRRHAVIERRAEGWWITNTGRGNPVVIQRSDEVIRVPPQDSKLLRSDDRLVVGTVRLQFFASDV